MKRLLFLTILLSGFLFSSCSEDGVLSEIEKLDTDGDGDINIEELPDLD